MRAVGGDVTKFDLQRRCGDEATYHAAPKANQKSRNRIGAWQRDSWTSEGESYFEQRLRVQSAA